jgi:hypothetical protein
VELFPCYHKIQLKRRVGGLLCGDSNLLLQRKPSSIALGTPVLIFVRAQHSPPPKREPRPRQPKVTVEEQPQWRPSSVQEVMDETTRKQQYEQQQQQQQQWEGISQETTANAMFVFLCFIEIVLSNQMRSQM